MYYLIGVNEPAMLSLAQFLKEMGYIVCCHHSEKTPLIEKVFTDQDCHKSTTVIKGQKISDEDERLIEAKKNNLRIYSFLEVLSFLIKKHKTIIVFEPKPKLSCLLSDVLDDLKGSNALIFDQKITAQKYKPYLVLNIEMLNYNQIESGTYYSIITSEQIEHKNFIVNNKEFLNKTEKIIIAHGDEQLIQIDQITKPIFLYGLKKENDINACNLEKSKNGFVFDVFVEDNYYGHFDFPIKNKKEINNLIAIIAICCYERFLSKDVSKSIKKFLKIKG